MKLIPTTIITGFLGSGKTTLIQNAVKTVWDKEKIAIIKNEISDVGVDALELSDPKLIVEELPNGCICCTLVGALNDSLNEIIEKYSPDRIFVEASGFAKPGQIAIGLELVERITVDGIIIVIDALNYTQMKEIEKSNAAKAVSEFVDLYIINKVDQVTEDIIDLIKDDILGNFPAARIIETNDANIPAGIIIGLHEDFMDYEVEKEERHNHDFTEFESFVLENLEIKDLNIFQEKLEKLPKTVYRIKGYFSFDDENYILNVVAGKVEIKETEKELPDKSKIVYIGKEIGKYRGSVEKLLNSN